ncbi:MAG: OmpA family protein [Hydrogenophaga sp.]|uniref:OmpA family protein n=1 Tax=Hydrogenophaga sp. TaxID=1904254 RepID=UPI0025BB2C00|nr:OmpA family protein [Hydrogenophaga sp.]MBT9551701.1 OmpA family protein [Hydrogenophaga sp.]
MPRLSPALRAVPPVLLLALAACSTPPRGGGAPPAPRASDPPSSMEVPAVSAFDKGRSAVKPGLARQLNDLGKRLESRPTFRVHIVGNGDEGRSDAANRMLALDRALSVRDYLLARGADITRLTTEGKAGQRQLELRVVERK